VREASLEDVRIIATKTSLLFLVEKQEAFNFSAEGRFTAR
jgi:hypothetical protein